MAWSCAYDWAMGASVRDSVSVVIPGRIRYYGVTTGVVMVWWQNSTISEIYSALVSCVMMRWHQ